MYLVISRLVLRAGYGIRLYQFLIFLLRWSSSKVELIVLGLKIECDLKPSIYSSHISDCNGQLIRVSPKIASCQNVIKDLSYSVRIYSHQKMAKYNTMTKSLYGSLYNYFATKRIYSDVLFDGKNDVVIIWARSCENVSYAIYEQQRCRSACASAQSDHTFVVRFLDSIICILAISKV